MVKDPGGELLPPVPELVEIVTVVGISAAIANGDSELVSPHPLLLTASTGNMKQSRTARIMLFLFMGPSPSHTVMQGHYPVLFESFAYPFFFSPRDGLSILHQTPPVPSSQENGTRLLVG
jgi:hypothetical protein